MEAYMHASIHCYVDIYLHTLIDSYIHPSLHTCLHTYVHTSHTQTIRRTCIHPSYMHTCRGADIPTACVTFMQACIHTWIHRCIQVYILRNRHFYVPHAVIPSLFSLNTHTGTSLQAYIPPQLHPYMHAHCTATKPHLPTCLQAYAPRHVHTCRHKYMQACIHACIPA